MKFSFKSFVIGFACAALSLGAVTYANAAGDATLKACANKTTGAMRYISKGSCKKTEKSLSWNQMGPQGLPGSVGAKGDNGTSGTNGQNFHVIDAAGRDLGIPLGVYNGGQSADINFKQGIWTIQNISEYPLSGGLTTSGLYSDSSCLNHIWSAPNLELLIPSIRGVIPASGSQRYVAPIGEPFQAADLPIFYRNMPDVNENYSCVSSLNPVYAAKFQGYMLSYLTLVQDVTPPAYTAPFTIVAK
jgi:hypothetical protein